KHTSSRSVVGIDLTLAHLSERLADLSVLPGMRIVLFDEQGRILARSDTDGAPDHHELGQSLPATLNASADPLISALRPAVLDEDGAVDMEIGGEEWKIMVQPIETPRGPLYLATAVPLNELLKDLRDTRERHVLISLALLLCGIPLTMLTAHFVTR